MAFLFPPEVLRTMAKVGSVEKLLEKKGLDKVVSEHLAKAETLFGHPLVPISLWGDGVPYNWDRSRSIECCVWSLPGQAESPWKNLTVPFVVFPAELMGPSTQNEILEVFVWSLTCLFQGKYPQQRHDSEPWQSSDNKRKALADRTMPVRGLLVSVKGDWKEMANVFGFQMECASRSSNLLEV